MGKSLLTKLATAIGIDWIFRNIHNNDFLIVMYHGVLRENLPVPCWWQLDLKTFESQIRFLKKHYNVLSLRETMSMIQSNQKLPKNTAVITFDDGYENNFTVAYPLLRELQLPATIYLVTDLIGTNEMLWPDLLYISFLETTLKQLDLTQFGMNIYSLKNLNERNNSLQEISNNLKNIPNNQRKAILSYITNTLNVDINKSPLKQNFCLLSWEQVENMQEDGLFEFGAHSSTHPILSQLSNEELNYEITNSCKKLEGKPVLFAYPNGRKSDFDSRSKVLLKQSKVLCAVSTIEGLNKETQDPLELYRIGIGSNTSMDSFRLMCSGFTSKLKQLIT